MVSFIKVQEPVGCKVGVGFGGIGEDPELPVASMLGGRLVRDGGLRPDGETDGDLEGVREGEDVGKVDDDEKEGE